MHELAAAVRPFIRTVFLAFGVLDLLRAQHASATTWFALAIYFKLEELK